MILRSKIPEDSDHSVIRMAVRAEQARESDRSMPVIVATEKPVVGWDRSYNTVDQVLLMDKANLPTGTVTLVDSHDASTVENTLGSVRDWSIEDDKGERRLVARLYFSGTQRGFDAFRNYRDGHLNDVSIRAYATESVLRIEPEKTGTVDGRTFKAGARPTDVFVRWSVYEVSAVVKGADVDAKVRRAAEMRRAAMQFSEWLVKRGLKLEDLDEAKRAELQAEFEREQTEAKRAAEEVAKKQTPPVQPVQPVQRNAEPAPAIDPAVIDKLVAERVDQALAKQGQAEVERVAKVRGVCRGEFPEIEAQAIAERWDEAKTGAEVLAAVRKRMDSGVGSPAVHVKGGDIERSLIVDAMRVRAGAGDDIVREDKTKGEERANRADEFRHLSLLDVCRHALRIEGKDVPHREDEMLRAAASTITLPQILGAVANKFMMKGYTMASATWRAWCSTGSVRDFKANTGVRLTDVGDLEEVGFANGEIKDGKLSEEYEQFTLARYAKKVIISEVHLINDDLGMLSKVPQGMGDRAASLISKLVYTHLLANAVLADGVALFDASTYKNYQTGSTYALSAGATALRKALELFRKQVNSDGEPLDINPAVLLCSPENEEYARALLKSITLAEGTTAGLATANIWGSLGIAPVIESRLSNSNYTGYSTTGWYLIGNPNQVDTVQVSFRNGQQAPRLEYFNQSQMGIDSIAVGYRVIQDAVAKALDFRGMVKMAGA